MRLFVLFVILCMVILTASCGQAKGITASSRAASAGIVTPKISPTGAKTRTASPITTKSPTASVSPSVVPANDAFRLVSPLPGAEVGSPFTVEGEARVFEAAFSWKLEAGHQVVAQGHEMADGGAPAWGRFQFDVRYSKLAGSGLTLSLFIYSPKDGSTEQVLSIPLKAKNP